MDSMWVLFEANKLGVRLRLGPGGSDRILGGPACNITDELREGIKENREMLRKDLMIRDAHEFLAGSYVEGADLSELDGWHEVIGRTYAEADPGPFALAVRAYTRAGLRAFARAETKNGVNNGRKVA